MGKPLPYLLRSDCQVLTGRALEQSSRQHGDKPLTPITETPEV